MSLAGTPSSDPWVVLPRERTRYEDQFRSLKPVNGVVTGDQAKGFLLQSQLPPMVLGQIWGLADTDADGKMDINEFSIACKLINLKLRGFELPKVLPPTLIASLRALGPAPVAPTIPPLPNAALVNAPPRPEPPKIAPMIPQQPIVRQQSPLISGMPNMVPMAPVIQPMGMPQNSGQTMGGIPTGIVPPMPSTVPPLQQQPLIGSIAPMPTVLPTQGIPPPLVVGIPPMNGTSLNNAQPVSGAVPMPIPAPPMSVPRIPPVANAALISPGGVAPPQPLGPSATSTPRASVTSLERGASVESPQVDWAVPHPTKLKYTQIFNTTDRTRSGFLSGVQARNIMVQSKLPQNILAQIWALSDLDGDGRLGCEEFVLAMHFCDLALVGQAPPAKLPSDLVPPSFRKIPRSVSRTASISSQGSIPLDLDPASTLLQTSFEDKRKENFDKGQAELDRRRKTLQDQQRKEAEERERKEREEQDKREKARQEVERKRLEEIEKQMREQQEKERRQEEERKRQADQREAARKEMERQRQLEWEKQRLQELQQQRQREQETVLKLKGKNQSLTIDLGTLNDQVKDLSQKICETRLGVSNVKSTIDGMRSTRDIQMTEMSQLKNKLKEQNARLLALSQEKIKMEAKNKINAINEQDADQARIAFENKEITIKNLKQKVQEMESEIESKMRDIDNNQAQFDELQAQLQNLVDKCESLYATYEEKRNKVLELKNSTKAVDFGTAWKDDAAWSTSSTQDTAFTAQDTAWPVTSWSTDTATTEAATTVTSSMTKYRALYEFVARNQDEISFQPGDIINVSTTQTGEPGWLAGEIRGHTGWFPESYVEPVDEVVVNELPASDAAFADAFVESVVETQPLEGIAEVPESSFESIENKTVDAVPTPAPVPVQSEEDVEEYLASYPYQSSEPGDLTFNAGDVIIVVKKDGDWWTGRLNGVVGIFPSNYVKKVTEADTSAPTSASSVTENFQMDNEVSQINEGGFTANFPAMGAEVPLDFNITSNAQVVKGKKPEIASVIAPYQATSSEQLSLARGQLIMIRKKTESGWWEGELQAKGRKRQVGWFPASYVKVLNSSGRISGRTTPVSTTRMQQELILDKVVALYSYTAGNPDELTFSKDDIISVTAREEEAWWRGELNGLSGLFPSNYVSPLQQSNGNTHRQSITSSPVIKKRMDAINELIQTETAYIEDMQIALAIFQKPLKTKNIISNKDIDDIFLNCDDIIECNKLFLQDLKERYDNNFDKYGDVIYNNIPTMTPYIIFCSKQLDSAKLLQGLCETSVPFKNFLKHCQNDHRAKGLPLSSFLLKPMQRITKYPLIIAKILENTPEEHLDFPELTKALQQSEEFLSCINENIRVKENIDRMIWLQNHVQNDMNIIFHSNTNKLGPRKLIQFGIFYKVKNNKELIGFLFNDFFLLVQPSKNLGTAFSFQKNAVTYKMYKHPILIQNINTSISSTENVEQGTDSNRVLKVTDDFTNYTIYLLAASVSECNVWTKNISTAKYIYSKVFELNANRPNSVHEETGTKQPSCGRLLVLVQYGKRFILSVFDGMFLNVTLVEASDLISRCSKARSLKRAGKTYTDNIYCKVTLGEQEHLTDIAKDGHINGNHNQRSPQVPILSWDYTMQFQLRNIYEEVLTFAVYELNPYIPDVCLGRVEINVIDIFHETSCSKEPITKTLILHQAESGELVVKLDLRMFNEDL